MLTSRMKAVGNHLLRSMGSSGTEKMIYNRKSEFVVEAILNREKALNSLDLEMIRSLSFQAEEWNRDGRLKAVLLRGQGKKSFCAGGDVKCLYEARVAETDLTKFPVILDTFFREEFTCDYKLATLRPSLIALWDGIVMGGGVGISINAPFKIATENSMFAMPEAKIGFFTDVGGGFFLSRLKDNIGLYLGLTSQRLKGKDLVRAGIAHYFMPSERVPELERQLFDCKSGDGLTREGITRMLEGLSEKVEGDLPEVDQIRR